MAIDKIFNDANVDGIADNIFGAVNNSVSEVKQMQQRKAAENVQKVVEAFKKIETNITEKFDNVTDVIEKRVLTIKDGRDGSSGTDGRNGRDGKPGRDGVNGKQGPPGTPGKDGVDGEDGVSVTNANIDFDGSLVISLSSGQQINVGEVVAPDLAEKIKIVSTMSTNGAVGIKDEGSSISTGVKNINFVGATVTATASGDDVTVNVSAGTGTVQSVAATVPAFLSVAGSPITTTGTLAISLSGTALPVANGGTGITSFGTGVATALGVNTGTAGAFVVNGGALGTPASGTVTNLTGTASININGTVGATTANTGAFTSLTASTTLGVTGVSTLTAGAVVQGLTVGLGGGAISTNTAVGVSALQANTVGANNTAIGYQSGYSVIGNGPLVAVGYQAGYTYNAADDWGSVFVGWTAGKLTTGKDNIAVGGNALVTNSSGAFNTAIGAAALKSNTTASNNVAVGYQAGYYNTSGNVTYVGYRAGANTTGTLNAFFGNDSGISVTTGAKNTIIGAYTGNQGSLDIRTADNYIVLSDGDGNPRAYWNGANATFNGALALTGTLTGGTSGTAYSFSGSAPATSLTLDSSGQLGIGEATPTQKVHAKTASTTYYLAETTGTSASAGFRMKAGASADYTLFTTQGVNQFAIYDNAASSQRVTLDSSGNLGLGVTPSAWSAHKILQVGAWASFGSYDGNLNSQVMNNAYWDGGAYRYIGSSQASYYSQTTGVHGWYNAPSGTAGNPITFTQAMTLDASGNLLVGTSSQTPGYGNTNTGQQLGGSSVSTFSRSATDFVIVCNQNTVDGSTYYQMQFRVSDVSKGSITSSSSATAYNTSSDYRLKNTIAPMTGALAKVALLKPCTYKWNADGSDGEGFIAHELAEVVPQCVTGEKDAVNEDGSIKSQGIDTSFLVATLTAAIQEQQALITQLTARITALETA